MYRIPNKMNMIYRKSLIPQIRYQFATKRICKRVFNTTEIILVANHFEFRRKSTPNVVRFVFFGAPKTLPREPNWNRIHISSVCPQRPSSCPKGLVSSAAVRASATDLPPTWVEAHGSLPSTTVGSKSRCSGPENVGRVVESWSAAPKLAADGWPQTD